MSYEVSSITISASLEAFFASLFRSLFGFSTLLSY